METFTRWVYYFLESLGLDLSYMTNLNRLIVLVLIAVLAFLTDWICRKGNPKDKGDLGRSVV